METTVSTAPAARLRGAAGAITTFRRGSAGRAGAFARPVPLRRGVRLLICALQGALTGVLLLMAAATLPTLLGYHSYVVYGGSMGDDLPAGSVAVARTVDAASLGVGEIIALEREGANGASLHRIVSIEIDDGQRVATTQGDANETPDPKLTILSGRGDTVIYHVPYAGYILHYIGSGLGTLLLIGVPLTLLAVSLLREAWRIPGKKAASSGNRSVAAANRSPRPDPSPTPKAKVSPESS